ncbi:MAG: type VI secretion system baseplate subunit TssK [Deltaproteobacteria bacterium]|nr:type VI secretion system baseplate subunit TssK [Deltaproteobacteria bacterium]
MECSKQVYWHEGLFLRPHHFQQQDLFHQSQIRDVLGACLPFAWGVVSQGVVEAALANETFEVARGEWIFPDGTLVRAPGNARLAPRPFAGLWDAAGAPLPVYLGLKKLAPGARNLERAGEGRAAEGSRFWASEDPTPTQDLYVSGREEPVFFVEYNLRLFFGDEIARAGDYQCLKIAEVQRYGNEIRMADGFVPPTVSVEGSALLGRYLRDVREKLTSRARDLTLYKQDQRRGAVDLGSRDFLYFVALMILNRQVPAIHHLTETPKVSPWLAYAMLRETAGELSTLSTRRDALGRGTGAEEGEGLPAYRHEDLGTCFQSATRLIFELLDELVAGPDYVVDLLFDGTYYYADLIGRIFEGNNRYYLSVRTAFGQDAVINALLSTSKLSSREYLPIVIARALPGVPLEHLASPPAELPRRPDTLYFALDPSGGAWEAVRNGLNAAVYFDSPPGEIGLQLMVIYGK